MGEQVARLAVESLADPGQGAEPDRPGVAVFRMDRFADMAADLAEKMTKVVPR